MTEKSPTVQTPDDAEALRRENEQLLTKLKYLQAEFENYRKRAERDAETFVRFAHEALLASLLPVLDEMDAAVAAMKDESAKGVRMVRDNLVKTLREAGLTRARWESTRCFLSLRPEFDDRFPGLLATILDQAPDPPVGQPDMYSTPSR